MKKKEWNEIFKWEEKWENLHPSLAGNLKTSSQNCAKYLQKIVKTNKKDLRIKTIARGLDY